VGPLHHSAFLSGVVFLSGAGAPLRFESGAPAPLSNKSQNTTPLKNTTPPKKLNKINYKIRINKKNLG
jgi:hypothetical protein